MLRPRGQILVGVRWLLGFGFGGLLVLLVSSGTYTIRNLIRADAYDDHTIATFIGRSEALNEFRTAFGRSTSHVRNYLIDPNPKALPEHRAQAEKAWRDAQVPLATYRRLCDAEERPVLEHLQFDAAQFWQKAEQLLALAPGSRLDGYDLFEQRLVPSRETVQRDFEDLRRLDELSLRHSILGSSHLIEQVRSRLTAAMLIAFAVGLPLAAVTYLLLMRLERVARQQYEESLEDQRELESLSARLVEIQEEERRRIARELHDAVGQTLSALLVDVGRLLSDLSPEQQELRTTLESVKGLGEATLASTRNIMLLLRPSMLDDLGLMPTLRWQARETSRRTGISVELTAGDQEMELPDSYRTTIYRVVQEALHNASRHSGAKRVTVLVREEAERILVIVQDDGKGFDPRTTKGMGLLGMQERVAHLNGKFSVHSEPGQGTIVQVELPAPVRAQQPVSSV